MHFRFIYRLFFFTVIILAACKDNSRPPAGSGTPVTSRSDSAIRNYADGKYVAKVYGDLLTENTINSIAMRRSKDPGIIKLASELSDSYEGLSKKIEKIAVDKHIYLDPKQRFDQEHHISFLESEAQAVFDREYLNVLIREHRKFLEDFQLTGTNSRDSTVSALAAEVLKAVSANYAQIMIIQAEMRK